MFHTVIIIIKIPAKYYIYVINNIYNIIYIFDILHYFQLIKLFHNLI